MVTCQVRGCDAAPNLYAIRMKREGLAVDVEVHLCEPHKLITMMILQGTVPPAAQAPREPRKRWYHR